MKKFCDWYIEEMIQQEYEYGKNIFIRNIDHMNGAEKIVHISNLLFSEKAHQYVSLKNKLFTGDCIIINN